MAKPKHNTKKSKVLFCLQNPHFLFESNQHFIRKAFKKSMNLKEVITPPYKQEPSQEDSKLTYSISIERSSSAFNTYFFSPKVITEYD